MVGPCVVIGEDGQGPLLSQSAYESPSHEQSVEMQSTYQIHRAIYTSREEITSADMKGLHERGRSAAAHACLRRRQGKHHTDHSQDVALVPLACADHRTRLRTMSILEGPYPDGAVLRR